MFQMEVNNEQVSKYLYLTSIFLVYLD